MRRWVASFLIGLFVVVHSAATSSAERRVALVIGNSKYLASGLELANPKNDSQDVATALRDLGFEVVHKADATKRDFDTTLQTFARLSAGADSALFFYAGHAMQYQGRNYLVPIDAELDDEISIRYQTVAVDDIRAALDQVTGVKIVILDACRNNPLANRLNRMMAGQNRAAASVRGLARIDKTQGMVVAYATSADDVALDGEGRNSPFTGALVRRMQEPGLEIEMMFRRVTADVNTQTRGRQRPETYISLLNEYYLNQSDSHAWDRIKETTDVAALRDFVARFPSSGRAPDARYRLDLLERLAEERKAEQRESARRRAEDEAARQREAEERAKKDEAARVRQQAEQDAERQRIARREEEEKAVKAREARRLAEEDAVRRREAEQEAKKLEAARARQQGDQEAERQRIARREEEERVVKAREAGRLADEEAARRREAEQEAKKLAAAREAELTAQKQAKLAEEKAAAEAAAAKKLADAARVLAEQEMARIQAMAQSATPKVARETQLPASSNAEAKPQSGDQASFALASAQPNLDDPPLPKPSAIAIDPVLEIQLELARVGCFTGPTSGVLDSATKSAVRNFLSHVRGGPSNMDANAELLKRLRAHEEPVCPIQCAKGQVADGDRCVAAREPYTPPRSKPARAPKPQMAVRPAAPKVRHEPAPISPPPPAAYKPAPSPARPIVGVGF
jgi:uncharacterized caspase-like protein